MTITNIKEEQAKQIENIKSQGIRVNVCTGTGCVANGALSVIEKFEKLGVSVLAGKCNCHDKKDVTLISTGCQGFCQQGVLVTIPSQKVTYVKVKEDDVERILDAVKAGKILEDLVYVDPKDNKKVPDIHEIGFYKKQIKNALRNCGNIDAECLNDALAHNAYQALAKVLKENNPDSIISEIEKSGLRGRGGGGFPTGRKWRMTAANKGGKTYIICNADEGDPGAFMDDAVMEGDPHRLLEGMIIAGFAVGSDEAYIYVRAEYPGAVKRLKIAIKQAEEAGLLGKNILGTDFNFEIHIKEGAGAFVCGEETAIIASIEGERGMPRSKPPYPANSGLFGRPTLINNVETFANVAGIILDGSDKFASYGTEKSKGTKTFSLTGEVNNTGLIEVPMGITLREIVYDIGGGIRNGKKFKAVQIGGPSGGCLTEQHLDLKMDYDNLIQAGAMIGSGGLVVMNEDTCIVEVARFFMNFTQSESCGKCVPCREGTKNLLHIMEKITHGKGEEKDLETLETLAPIVKAASLCGLGKTAPNPVLSTLKYFKDEYIAHIRDKKCPTHRCRSLVTIEIDKTLCKGCSKCSKYCPAGAISGTLKEPFVIDQTKCIKCGACVATCPFKAIKEN